MCYAPLLSQFLSKDGKAKTLANSKPILGVRLCAQDGGLLQNKKPRRSSLERREAGGPQGERLGFLLGYFLGNAKK